MTLTLVMAMICSLTAQETENTPVEANSTIQDKYDKFVNNQDADRDVEVMILEVKPISFRTEKDLMSQGEQTAVKMIIPEANLEEVQSGWEKLIKNKTKSKVQKELDEIYIDQTLITEIYQEPINLYGKIIEVAGGVEVTTFVEIDNEFIDESQEDKIKATQQFLRDFGAEQYRKGVEIELKEEQGHLKDLEQRLNKLQKENEKLHKNIKANEANVLNTLADIEVNVADQQQKADEVAQQKQYTFRVRGSKEKEKEAKKMLKDREKERKKLQKDNQDLHKSLAKYRAEIEESRREIQLNLDQQSIENLEIRKKVMLIRAIEHKIRRIE